MFFYAFYDFCEKKEIESRIDTSLELLVDDKVPKEKVIIKMQQDEQRLRDLQGKIILLRWKRLKHRQQRT